MREYEYEVMHIQSPTGSTSGFISNNHTVASSDDENDPEDFNFYSHSEPILTTPTTVIIREKRSFLHRLSHSLTITHLLGGVTSTNGVGASRLRQASDMKLKQRWILLAFIIFSIILILLLSTVQFRSLTKLASHQLGITVDLEELTDRHKCPACYGVNLCPAVFNEQIELNEWNKFSMSKLLNVKNIFYATFSDHDIERKVVLKKLAHNNELDELDKSICDAHYGKGQGDCDVSDTVIDLIEKYKIEQQDAEKPMLLNGEKIGKGSDLLLCPSHRKMDFIVQGAKKFLRGQHHDTILANVLTMLLLNPEPLLLQAFPRSAGWPFPDYYGACGRVIAEEYIGRRLTTYYNEPFALRAAIAKQLLEMANLFHKNPTNFIIYLTDMSPDNFAVDEDTNIVRAIDLENFIVVDNEAVTKNMTSDIEKLLESESTLCGSDGNADNMCFSFSAEDLCIRPLTDHNYYAVCAGLLAEGALVNDFPAGLLHSLPQEFSTNPKLKSFRDVLLKCKDPKLGNPNWHYTRVEAAQEVIHFLDVYLKSQQPQLSH